MTPSFSATDRNIYGDSVAKTPKAAQQALASDGFVLPLGLARSGSGSLRSLLLYSLSCSGILARVSAAGWAAAEAQSRWTDRDSDKTQVSAGLANRFLDQANVWYDISNLVTFHSKSAFRW